MLAGGLTMFWYWLITAMYIYVLPPTDQSSAPKNNLLSFIETRLLLGVIYVLFGLGLGGLGGRVPAARLLLDRLALSKPPTLPNFVPAPPPASALAVDPIQPVPEPDAPLTGAPLADVPSNADSASDSAVPATAFPIDSSPDTPSTNEQFPAL